MSILLVRPAGAVDDDARAIRARGYEVVADPYLTVAPSTDAGAQSRVQRLLETLTGEGGWLIVTSAAGPRALVAIAGGDQVREAFGMGIDRGLRFAAVGPASARSLHALGAVDVLVPPTGHTATALLATLAPEPTSTAVLPRSSIGDPLLPTTLTARGWNVVQEVVYETAIVPTAPTSAAPLHDGAFAAVVLRSPSAAHAVARWAGPLPQHTAVIAGGPTTALAAAGAGLKVSTVAASSRAEDIAEAVARATP